MLDVEFFFEALARLALTGVTGDADEGIIDGLLEMTFER